MTHPVNQSAVYATVTPPPIAHALTPATLPQSDANSAETTTAWRSWLMLALIPIALTSGVGYGLQKGRKQKSSAEEEQSIPDSEPRLEPLTPTSTSIAVSETTRLSRGDEVITLIHELHSLRADNRRKAIWELGQRGDSRAIQPLVDLLVDSDSQQRSLILAAVSEISVRTLKPMSRALMMTIQDESSEVRKNSIRDASRLFELVTQISQLLQYATSDGDREVQETAEWALSQLNRIRPMPGTEGLPSLNDHGVASPLAASTQSRPPFPEETDQPLT